MSTNPFRRSSLKGPSGSSGGIENQPVAPAPIDISSAETQTPIPLTVNTKAPLSTQKHVNFASPPAIPISPVSYPPSPESTRLSPEYTFAKVVPPTPTDYSGAIHSDPFRADARDDEDDGAIQRALQNAKVNTTLAAPNFEASKQDAVRNTLSRFASAPKRPATGSRDHHPPQTSVPTRQTMDVDAFKRLLLTGDRGPGARQEDTVNHKPHPGSTVMNDNSSGTDTASISQRSLFDYSRTRDDSSRSSDEMDTVEADAIRHSVASGEGIEGSKRPPPPAPAPRHGKPIKDDSMVESSVDLESPQAPTTSSAAKKAPTPPLARRHSQNSAGARPTSSRNSSSSEIGTTTALNENASVTSSKIAPPPPRSRRPVTNMDRRPSSDLPITVEESDPADTLTVSSRKVSDSRPAPPPARNSSKRVSVGATHVPPLPPPRRGRGSSRSSIDSQRPSVSTILNDGNTEAIGGDVSQPGPEARRESSGKHSYDILADLAALQREVDEARRKVSR